MAEDLSALRKRIYSLLASSLSYPSWELLKALRDWWTAMGTEFGTKMGAWKAGRIDEIDWWPPLLTFTITRHPGAWERRQRWTYDFDSNRASVVSEWGLRQNAAYTTKQATEDAKEIVKALTSGRSHPCLQRKGDHVTIWLGRLPDTKPVPYVLPHRTAKGRQARLKKIIAEALSTRPQYQRDLAVETTDSLVYRASGRSQKPK